MLTAVILIFAAYGVYAACGTVKCRLEREAAERTRIRQRLDEIATHRQRGLNTLATRKW